LTIVLRFSDYEADTFREHADVITGSGSVWWGWWKKRHEAYPRDIFDRLSEQIAENGQARIGLVERVEGACLVGICDKVVWDGEQGISAPELDKVPAYYREQKCPAWFRLLLVERVSNETWEAEFGTIPLGDATVFESPFSGSAPSKDTKHANRGQTAGPPVDQAIAEQDRSQRPTTGDVKVFRSQTSPGRGILHISDLHFGSDFGYAGTALTEVAGDLMERLLSALPGEPAALVVSGDLTTRGEHQGLTQARLFIERLAESLCLPREAVVIAPGNHDIQIDGEVTRDMENEQDFRDLVNLFYGSGTGLERVHVVKDANNVTYVLGVLNSSRPRTKLTMDYGYVGADRSEPVMRLMESERSQASLGQCWSAVVLHHHIVPAPLVEALEEKRPVSVSLDAGELVSMGQQFGVHAFLHGHQHLPFVGTAGRLAEYTDRGPVLTPQSQEVLILGSGSTGVAHTRLPEEIGQNAFNFYLPRPDGVLDVRVMSFNRRLKAGEVWHLTRPF